MTSYNNLYWGTLIDAGKKPSPLLEQLCLGLAKIIGDLEPGTSPDNELTPCRLAAFYKSCGGDFDELFNKTSSHALSFIYKTIGCVHSLQPTTPYDTPSVPALKPLGYLRWQTIQLQLSPEQHVPFLQRAVMLYDVPKPDGGIFPKHIPTEAFPAQPDKDIENWWKVVTYQLDQENHMQRLSSSPYRSPPENGNRTEYFTQNGRLSASSAQRPHRPSRHSSEDKAAEARRRSSVPELIYDQNADDRPDSKRKSSRSRSAHRISSGPYNYPPPSTGPQRHHTSAHRHQSNTSSPYRPLASVPNDPNGHHRHKSSGGHTTPHRRNRSPSVIKESTGSEDSSEESRTGRDRKKQEDHRRSSLWPPNLMHRRRHSHDATYEVPERRPTLPPRPIPIQTHVPRTDYNQQSPPSSTRRRGFSNLNNVHFRNDMFTHDQATNSALETPIAPDYIPNQMPISRMRYEPPPQNMHLLQGAPLSRATSGENSREDQNRNFGAPTRSRTVTMGVGGRRYPAGEPQSTGATSRRSNRTMSAAPVGLSQSG